VPTSQSTTPLDLIAHHEASHFVVGALFEIPITEIKMKPDAKYDAAVATVGLMNWVGADPQRADQAAKFKLAGPSGEKKFLGRKDNSIIGHALNDLNHAEVILKAAPTKIIVAQRKYELIQRTDALLAVDDCWRSVCALAKALMAEPSLPVNDTRRIADITELRIRLSQLSDWSSLFPTAGYWCCGRRPSCRLATVYGGPASVGRSIPSTRLVHDPRHKLSSANKRPVRG
jgi:hypothetical protein